MALKEHSEFRPAVDFSAGEAERERQFFAALPAAPAVFCLLAAELGVEPYVGKSVNLRRRILRLLGPTEGASRRLSLRERARTLEYSVVGSDFEAQLVLYRLLRETFPRTYQQRLRLRPAPLLKLILENPYPRVAVTGRINSLRGRNLYYGPFATRAQAEQIANDALDFFLLRRCVEELSPAPDFPGCPYSEMKMCLAPCFQGCTDERYAEETGRVERFFASGGQSLNLELAHARDAASAELDFERAAAVHAKLEKLARLRSQIPEIARRLDRLDGVMIQRSAVPDSVALFRISAGRLGEPVQLAVGARAGVEEHRAATEAKAPASMESRISAALSLAPAAEVSSAQEWMENLALLKRWYYRTSKMGEVFFAGEKGELPMRRVVRAVSRVFKGEKPQAELSDTSGDYWIMRGREAGVE